MPKGMSSLFCIDLHLNLCYNRARLGETIMFKKGDRVKVKNYAKKFNGKLATVDRVNGFYVYVFLDCQPNNKCYPLELYETEVTHV